MPSACGSTATKTALCLTCGDKGETRLLIYCAKCKDAAVHHYCLDKFSPSDDEIYWVCWECENRINMVKAFEKSGEICTRREKDNEAQKSSIARRMVKANQGVPEMTQQTKSGYNLDIEMSSKRIEQNGNLINHCLGLQNAIYSSEECQLAKQELKCLDETEDLCSLKSSQREYKKGLLVDSVKNAQAMHMKQQRNRVKNRRRRLILDDSTDSNEEGQQDGKRRRKLILDGSSSSEENDGGKDGTNPVENTTNSSRKCSVKSSQRVYENDLSIESVKIGQGIDLKQQKRRVKNKKRIILDDSSDSKEEHQQDKKRRRTLILDGSNSSEEDDCAQDGISPLEKIKQFETSTEENLKQVVLEIVPSMSTDRVKCNRSFDENQRHYDVKEPRRSTLDQCFETKGRMFYVGDRRKSSSKIELIGAKTSVPSLDLKRIGTSTRRKWESRLDEIDPSEIASLVSDKKVKNVLLLDENRRNQEVEGRTRIPILGVNNNVGEVCRDYSVGVSSLASQQCAIPLNTSYGHLGYEGQRDICAQPIRNPVWRGCFTITSKKEKIDIDILAYLSNKASPKAFHAAVTLPSLLATEIQPKINLWPKSFHNSPPKDDSIALFFFSKHGRDEVVFERLLDVMNKRNHALKTVVVQDVELLIFSSIELPQQYQKFDSKYYLWGVFLDKRFSRTTPTSSYPIFDCSGQDVKNLEDLKILEKNEIAYMAQQMEKDFMSKHVQCAATYQKWDGLKPESIDLSVELQSKFIDFNNYLMNSKHSVKQHLLLMSGMIHELKELGVSLSNERQKQAIIRSLPNSWEQIKIYLTRNEKIKTFEDVGCYLESMEKYLMDGNPCNAFAAPYNYFEALYPKFENNGGVYGYPTINRREKVDERDKRKMSCYNCGKLGHFAHECRKDKSKMSCYNCGKLGHFARECSRLF